MTYLIEYTYKIDTEADLKDASVLYVVQAIDQEKALERMTDLFHSGYEERIFSEISQEEFDLLKTDQLAGYVWRVTRSSAPVLRYLNSQLDEAITFNVRSLFR